MFPFGYGLSYSSFSFTNLNLSKASIKRGDLIEVSVDVTNAGPIAADEVVQLYLHQRHGATSRPVRELKAFRRVTVAPRQTQTVRFTLDSASRRYWDSESRSWVEDASNFDLWAGEDSTAPLHTTFAVVR